jgi:hypothetical protein
MRRETKKDNIIFLTLLYKGERHIGIMPIEDKETV